MIKMDCVDSLLFGSTLQILDGVLSYPVWAGAERGELTHMGNESYLSSLKNTIFARACVLFWRFTPHCWTE